jgi:hypothetical protein
VWVTNCLFMTMSISFLSAFLGQQNKFPPPSEPSTKVITGSHAATLCSWATYTLFIFSLISFITLLLSCNFLKPFNSWGLLSLRRSVTWQTNGVMGHVGLSSLNIFWTVHFLQLVRYFLPFDKWMMEHLHKLYPGIMPHTSLSNMKGTTLDKVYQSAALMDALIFIAWLQVSELMK